VDVVGADASQEQGSSVATDVVPEHGQADLGGDETISEAPTEGLAEAEPTQFPEPALDDNVVEFELPESPSEQQLVDPEQPDAGNVIDFDLPADVPADAADESAPPPEVAASDADFSLAVDQDSASEDDDLEQISITDLEADAAPDFDLAEATDDSPDSTAWAADQGSDSSLEDVEFALDDLQPASDADQDFDLELESGDSTDLTGGEGSEDLELSLDEFDLSDSTISDDEGLATDVDADTNQAGGENNVVNHDDVVSTGDDMAGKLDLARAYIDMSELDMARSLLDEVALRGSDEQRAEAQAMLEQLG
jgi:pilus assembly protein FimV